VKWGKPCQGFPYKACSKQEIPVFFSAGHDANL
jgi:hypothetical protein